MLFEELFCRAITNAFRLYPVYSAVRERDVRNDHIVTEEKYFVLSGYFCLAQVTFYHVV